MLNEVELLCNLIKNKRINKLKLIEKLKSRTFKESEQKKIIECLLLYCQELDKSVFESFSLNVLEQVIEKSLDKGVLTNACLLVNFAKPDFLERIVNKVLETNHFDLICNLANNLPQEEIGVLEDKVISSKDVMSMYEFLSKVKLANKSKFEDAIIKTKDADYIFFAARDIEGINILKMQKAIIDLQKAEYAQKMAEHFSHKDENFSIKELEDCVIQYGTPGEFVLFAQEVKGADVTRLVKKLLESNDFEWIIYAGNIPGVDFNLLVNKIIESKDPYYIHKFASNFRNKPIDINKLEKSLLDLVGSTFKEEDKKNLAKYIFMFANTFQDFNINLEKLENALIQLNDFDYIYKFLKNIKNANRDKLLSVVLSLKNEMEISLIDYKDRNNQKISLSVWKNFVFTNLGVVVNNENEAIHIVTANIIPLIQKFGLVSLYLKLNSDYFNLKRIVLGALQTTYPLFEELLQVYYEFLTTNMDISEAIHLDFEYKALKEEKEKVKLKSLTKY